MIKKNQQCLDSFEENSSTHVNIAGISAQLVEICLPFTGAFRYANHKSYL
jgi:hypothetical protein